MKTAALASSLTALAAVLVMTDSAVAADQRVTTPSRFVVSVGGTQLTTAKSVDGGNVVVDVVKETSVEGRAGSFPKKRPGGTHIEPLVLEVGPSVPTTTWISEALNGNAPPKPMSVSTLDFDFKEVSRTEFSSARLVQVDFPALDGASRDAIYTQLTFQPDSVRRAAGSGLDMRSGAYGVPPHPFMAGNFKVTIGSLPCARVATVAPITVKTGPNGYSISNLILTISPVDQKPWQDWQDATLKDRPENSDANEKTGTIDYMSQDMQKSLARISLKGLGLVRLANQKREANQETTARFTAEMYVEDIKFGPVP